ncbi:MAG: p-hydroxybenzoic acid efflux subunit AaeA [Mucilaginibacter sp.]|jgi:multidrug efflux pump subunit AcrA (membrane-fusion protein)|nr:p-hydroxybenzoic acid efflux subunit AaeA [Mucilaginibacter sp.]
MKTPIILFSRIKLIFFIMGCVLFLFSCKGKGSADDNADNVKAQTPVTVTSINDSSMADYINLNAISAFLQKNYVKANANGYIQEVNTQLGHYVNKGDILFTIKTKEAQAIGNSINILDTTFKFSGLNKIKAAEHGYITQLTHQIGDYVQDGEQLAIISNRASFVFLMQLPYEMRAYVKINQDVQLTLPDGEKLKGNISSFMPTVDTLSQTQGVAIKINSGDQIPENLVAKARIVKLSKPNTASLPKSAILSNETQTDFWVMKLINPTTAIKVPVKEGIQTGDRVEIISPRFSPNDKIIVSGNYGLADTAKVKVVQ